MLDEHVRLEMQGEITLERALEIYDSGWWRDMGARDVASIQLQQRRVCMEWGEFVDIMQKALGRSVFTHEFIDRPALLAELNGGGAPTAEEVIGRVFAMRDDPDSIMVIDV